jgi:hypothetical protein
VSQIIYKSLIFFSLIFLSQCASIETAKKSRITEVTRNLDLEIKNTSNWSHFKPENHTLWLYSLKDQWLYEYKNFQFGEINFHENKKWIPENDLLFNVLESSQVILATNIDHKDFKQSPLIAHFILRELFITFHERQNSHWHKKISKTLVPSYPSLERPRYYRFEMILNLENFIKSKNKESLHAFSWWFKKWKDEFKDEFDLQLDRRLGAAEFYSYSQNILPEQNNILDLIKKYKKDNFTSQDFRLELFNLNNEAYYLGLLSGLSLVHTELDKVKWVKRLENGESFLDIISNHFSASPQKVNPQLIDQYISLNLKRMDLLDPLNILSQTLMKLSNDKTLRAVINNKKLQFIIPIKSQDFESFFNFKDLDHVTLTLLNKNLDLSFKGTTYTISPDQAWIKAKSTACNGSSNGNFSILLFDSPESMAKTSWGKIIKDSKKIVRKNINWYCIN